MGKKSDVWPFLALVTMDGEVMLGSDRPALFLAMTRNSYSLPSFRPSTVPLVSGELVSTPWRTQQDNSQQCKSSMSPVTLVFRELVSMPCRTQQDNSQHCKSSFYSHQWSPWRLESWSPRPGRHNKTINDQHCKSSMPPMTLAFRELVSTAWRTQQDNGQHCKSSMPLMTLVFRELVSTAWRTQQDNGQHCKSSMPPTTLVSGELVSTPWWAQDNQWSTSYSHALTNHPWWHGCQICCPCPGGHSKIPKPQHCTVRPLATHDDLGVWRVGGHKMTNGQHCKSSI